MGAKPVDILLVDDSQANLICLEAVLRSPEHNLVLANSGERALEKVLCHDFAAILLDVQMPGLSGFETAQEIKNVEKYAHIPIIYLTANSHTPFEIKQGYARGAIDYIFKPYDADILRSKVAVLVELYRKNQRILELERREYGRQIEATKIRVAKETERKLRPVIDNAPVIIWAVDQKGNYTLAEGKGLEALDAKPDTILGQNHFELFKNYPKLVENAQRALQGQSFTIDDLIGDVWFETHYAPLRNEQQEIIGMTGVSTDISARKKAELALEQRSLELAQSNAELEQFAYISSHDLKEPLRIVTVYSQMLQRVLEGKIEESTQKYFTYITDASKRMSSLITDLISFSTLAGKAANRNQFIDTEGSICDARAGLKVLIDDAQAEITCSRLPPICGNQTQITQLWQNLLGNSIKFRSDAPPKIHISCQENETEWVFSVADNGIGIEPCYKDKVFEVFQRLHNRTAFPGNGIGLAICKKVVELHGGSIWLEPSYRPGANFRFSIPKPRNQSFARNA